MPAQTNIQATSGIVRTARKQPLWDSEYIHPHFSNMTLFFQTPHNFSAPQTPRQKSHTDCNLGGSGGCLPQPCNYHLYKVGMLVDAGTSKEDAENLWNNGKLQFSMSQSTKGEWPVRLLMPPPFEIPTSEIGLLEVLYPLDLGIDVTVSGEPVQLVSLESFDFRLHIPTGIKSMFRVMVIMYGIMERASY